MNNILSAAGLPAADIYANQLGISGLPSITANQIYDDRFDDDGDDAIGADVGEDMEEDVEPELVADTTDVKPESVTPAINSLNDLPPAKKTRTVKRMVEKPKSVYERYPGFRPGKTLAFSELFKGYINRKSRISKRPFHGTYSVSDRAVKQIRTATSLSSLSVSTRNTEELLANCHRRRAKGAEHSPR